MTGPDGTPVASLLAPNDASLRAEDGGALFVAIFGTTRDRHARAPTVARITGATPKERGEALRHAHAAGYTAFAVEGDLSFDAAEIGSAQRPVLIVTSDRLTCAGPCRVHGLLYGDHADRPDSICRHPDEVVDEEGRRLHSVFGLAMDLDRGVLEVTNGPPCSSEFARPLESGAAAVAA